MLMLSLFPDLFSFSLAAPFIIRIFLGVYFLIYGITAVRNAFRESPVKKSPLFAGSAVAILSAGILVGFLTQGAAAILALFSVWNAWRTQNKTTHLLLFAMALSLLFSGAGFFAFDLPL